MYNAPRYICIHGHFYQPPRENPWLEAVEVQDSAAPYHDWNERITSECYEPNAHARILDEKGLIARVISNYERISWNFGPTLLTWLAAKAPRVYKSLQRADAQSQRRFSGHGSAMAQAYNHVIMPLAKRRDKRTQIIWGLRDFKHRFGRMAEGMWLPETAVDLETLDLLSECGLRFTVLAPHQARAVRPLVPAAEVAQGDAPPLPRAPDEFVDVSGGRIDPTRAYEIRLPSGRTLALFFYDGPVARAVAFEGLLNRGEDLVARLLSTLPPRNQHAQLVHIATDGETYGHHHKYGEMALAYALDQIEGRDDIALTNYGEFLARHPPTHEVLIYENTSWSCAHGIERWRSDCGCHTYSQPGWNQRWRAPLRAALDLLSERVAPLFEQIGGRFLRDPLLAHDDYIDVILDRSERSRARFLNNHAKGPLDAAAKTTVWKLMELGRYAQLMYTSCGWFFSDLGGPETVQDIQYAGRVLQLARELGEKDLEPAFLGHLEAARGNTAEAPTGRAVYERAVKNAQVDLIHVGAHHAISSLFTSPGQPAPSRIYCYSIKQQEQQHHHTGRLRLSIGRLHVKSDITTEEAALSYGALYLGDHNVSAGVLDDFADDGAADGERLAAALLPPFSRGDLPELLRTLDHLFGEKTYSLKHLFRDEQRAIIAIILDKTLRSVAGAFQHLYENHAPLMRFLSTLGVPQPGALRAAAEYAINSSLQAAVMGPTIDRQHIERLLDEANRTGIHLDDEQLRFALGAALDRLSSRLEQHKDDLRVLKELLSLVELAGAPPFQVNLFRTQNAYAELLETAYPATRTRQAPDGAEWGQLFAQLGERLHVKLPNPV